MLCDVCNALVPEGSGTRITASAFCELLLHGFGVDETNVKMLTGSGISRQEAIETLKLQYLTFNSDWLLCTNCADKAKNWPRN